MHTINSKASTRIEKQRVITNNSTKKIKWNKKYKRRQKMRKKGKNRTNKNQIAKWWILT